MFSTVHTRKNIKTTQLKIIPLRDEIMFYCFFYQVYSTQYLDWLHWIYKFSGFVFASLMCLASGEPTLLHIPQEFSFLQKLAQILNCYISSGASKWQTSHLLAFSNRSHVCLSPSKGFIFDSELFLTKSYPRFGWNHLWSRALQKSCRGGAVLVLPTPTLALWHQLWGGWSRGQNSSAQVLFFFFFL